MAQSTMRLDSELMARLQKIKADFLAKYHKNISLGEVIQRMLDKDVLMMALLNNNEY